MDYEYSFLHIIQKNENNDNYTIGFKIIVESTI